VQRYERTCVVVDIDEEHFYIVDLFDVESERDPGELTTRSSFEGRKARSLQRGWI
jgi:hypothetical protein